MMTRMKTLISIIFMLLLSINLSAQEVMALAVTTVDGQKQYFVLNDMPVARITTDNLVIRSQETEYSYPLEVVDKWVYTRVMQTKNATVNSSDMQGVMFDGQLLLFGTCDIERSVTVTNASGQVLRSMVVAPESTVQLSLGALAPGMYVVAVNDVTIKVIKK